MWKQYDRHHATNQRYFKSGQLVFICDYWRNKIGLGTFIWREYANQIRPRGSSTDNSDEITDIVDIILELTSRTYIKLPDGSVQTDALVTSTM
uniref:DDE_Tnp_1_7 domain-containing protein n=1 Tax=Heterorhabditis bacteriophora TaxID=37862 RepID=A0A1I7XKW2_HETBA